MKRIAWILYICFSVFCMNGCSVQSDIPRGYVSKEEYFDKNGWQDFTDYCKYYYSSTPVMEDSQYRMITESDVEDIKGYFSDFQRWMEAANRMEEYDFDESCITAGDYVRIRTKEGKPIGSEGHTYGKYDNYTLYFLDVDSNVLFYIHSNI